MSLIEIDVPDGDDWQDNVAARVLALLFGAMLLRFGLVMWGAIEPFGAAGALPTFLCFAVGVQLMLLSVANIDYERWGRAIGYATTLVVAGISLGLVVAADLPRLGTDLLAFTSYAVELVDTGVHPQRAAGITP